MGGGGGEVGSLASHPSASTWLTNVSPPVLPSTGGGDSLAIIRTESGTLDKLVSAFLDLVRDYEVPVGTVVVISSLTHLGRVGTAVYAWDLFKALTRLREGYGGLWRFYQGSARLSCGGWGTPGRSLHQVIAGNLNVAQRNGQTEPAQTARHS
jgi:hypothetical protein